MPFSLLSSSSSSPSAITSVAPDGPTQKLSPFPARRRSPVRQSVPSCSSREATTAWSCWSFGFSFPFSSAVVTDFPNSGLSRGPRRASGSDTSTMMGASAGIQCATGGKSSPWIEKATKNRGTREATFAGAFRNIVLQIIRNRTPESYKKGFPATSRIGERK